MDEALIRAYNTLRKSHWPPFDKAMEDPLYSRLIRSVAWHHANKRPCSEPPPAAPTRLRPMPAVDRKRLAAGDKDE